MSTWSTQAAAKLNLTLEVIGKRPDGFHNLESIVTSLDLADDVRLTRMPSGLQITYRDDAGRRISIETADDIIAKTWSALRSRCSLPGGARVEVVKRIPITGGLGGGSTDAAALLRLARKAWELQLSDDELCQIGAEVGSDVPVCLLGGAARMSGRGEIVTPLDASEALSGSVILLHRPEIPVPAVKTASMYRSLRSSDWRDGSATEALQRKLLAGQALTHDDCVNSFDRVSREVMQGLTAAWRTFGAAIASAPLDASLEPVTPLLAGAGPTMFAVLPRDVASEAESRLEDARGFTYVARPLSRESATAVQESR